MRPLTQCLPFKGYLGDMLRLHKGMVVQEWWLPHQTLEHSLSPLYAWLPTSHLCTGRCLNATGTFWTKEQTVMLPSLIPSFTENQGLY